MSNRYDHNQVARPSSSRNPARELPNPMRPLLPQPSEEEWMLIRHEKYQNLMTILPGLRDQLERAIAAREQLEFLKKNHETPEDKVDFDNVEFHLKQAEDLLDNLVSPRNLNQIRNNTMEENRSLAMTTHISVERFLENTHNILNPLGIKAHSHELEIFKIELNKEIQVLHDVDWEYQTMDEKHQYMMDYKPQIDYLYEKVKPLPYRNQKLVLSHEQWEDFGYQIEEINNLLKEIYYFARSRTYRPEDFLFPAWPPQYP
ncbi:hypothetical protein EDC01DRAFT_636182 [Geopyxis carbonaria]|nr:hypothetical protein EDC01DRAFT_636182 [Geopyxis carbonaria]